MADLISMQMVKEPLLQAAAAHHFPGKDVETAEGAIQGWDILAGVISDNANCRTILRDATMNKGVVQSSTG